MTHLLTHYDDIKGSAELLTYLETAAVADGDWQVLKGIYKKLEQAPNEAALVAVINKVDQASLLKQQKHHFPTVATLGYMKRRMARYLRQLATENEAMYVRICANLLKKQTQNIDIKHQWVMMDIIWGRSPRFEQTRHGRGKFIQKKLHNIYRTEEKYPEIWDRHLSVLKDILLTEGLAMDVYEFAVKVLLRNKQNISDFIFTQVARFYESSSPWLWSVANEQCFEAIARGSLHDVKLMAYTYFYASPNRRIQLWKAVQEINNVPEEKPSFLRQLVNYFMDDMTIKQKNRWMEAFMEELNIITFNHIEKKNFSRRVLKSIEVLSKDLNHLSLPLIQKNALDLLESKHLILEELVFKIIEKATLLEVRNWLAIFENTTLAQQEKIYDIFIKKFAQKINVSDAAILNQFIYHDSFFVAHFGWKVAIKLPSLHEKTVQNLIQHNWWAGQHTPAFQHLFLSAEGSQLVLQYCQQQLKNLIYYRDQFIYVTQIAQGELKTFLTDLIVENARLKPDQWLYHLRNLEHKELLWHRIKSSKHLAQIKDQFVISYLLSNDDFLYQIAWHILKLKPAHPKTYQAILYSLVIHSHGQHGERFLQQVLQLDDEKLKHSFLKELKAIIAQNPRLISKFTAIFDQIIPDLDHDSLLMLIEMVEDTEWLKMKEMVCQHLENGTSTDFWLQALKAMPEADNNRLYERLVQDATFVNNFYNLSSINVLEVKHPIFTHLLTKWIQQHQDLFATNSTALQSACIHAVAEVRHWALQRANILGMNATFALQLLESGMPDAVAFGKTFFQQLLSENEEVFDNLMMLCDSPRAEVRTFGMQLFQDSAVHMQSPMALAFLSEHADSQVQAFVAEQVMKTNMVEKPFVKPFEASVLSTRNRSRKAKEIIKTRIENQDFSTQNIQMTSPDTLLQLARSTNKLDAEWAILQLTKMSLAGKEIEGFTV